MDPLTIPCYVLVDAAGRAIWHDAAGVEECSGTTSRQPLLYTNRRWADSEARRRGLRVVEAVATVEALDAPAVVEGATNG